MRGRLGASFVSMLTLLATTPAAAVLLPTEATFQIELGTFPSVQVHEELLIDASTAATPIVAFEIGDNEFFASLTTPVSPPIALLSPFVSLTGVSVNAWNGTGNFTVAGGVMPLQGVAQLLLRL